MSPPTKKQKLLEVTKQSTKPTTVESKAMLSNSSTVENGNRLCLPDDDELKQIELDTHGLVCNIGNSWFKALEPQFSKPYFVQVIFKSDFAGNLYFRLFFYNI